MDKKSISNTASKNSGGIDYIMWGLGILFIIYLIIYYFSSSNEQPEYVVYVDNVKDKNVFALLQLGQDNLEYIKLLYKGKEVQIVDSEESNVFMKDTRFCTNVFKAQEDGIDMVELKFKDVGHPIEVFTALDTADDLLSDWMSSGEVRNQQLLVIEDQDKIVKIHYRKESS